MKASAPLRCVVDTNVPKTADRGNASASDACVAEAASALQAIMSSGHLFIDQAGQIVAEYRRTLNLRGQRGPGGVFLKWLLDHEWGGKRVTRVPITPKDDDQQDFVELPSSPDGAKYDPSDRKFLAVAAAHPERPPILQALDSKWWGWRDELARAQVTIVFLCEEEIARKHAEKMGI